MTVCDGKTDGTGWLVSIYFKTGEVCRRQNKANALLNHSTKNFIAVRAEAPENPNHTLIHVYNMDTKEKLVTSRIPDQIKFWIWFNSKILGLVGTKGLFHITVDASFGINLTANGEKFGEKEGGMLEINNPV